MTSLQTPLPRSRRLTVNLDAETAASIDALAFMLQESRSAVISEVLVQFVPMFLPVAQMVKDARERPKEAIKAIQAHAQSMRLMAEQALQQAMDLDAAGLGPGAHAPAGAPGSGLPPSGPVVPTPPPSNTGG